MADVTLRSNTVLAVLAERTNARSCLDAAAAAAAALDHPTIVALHVRANPMDDIIPTEEILLPGQQRAMEIEATEEGRYLQRVYSDWASTAGQHVETSWLDLEDRIEEEVSTLGAQASLSVMARITSHSRGHARAAFHACLFRTHKPLLVAPTDYRLQRLKRISIGWKDTPAARRALESAEPWLRQAEAVRLACIGRPEPLEIDWAREYFADRDIKAEISQLDRQEGISVGAQLLEQAKRDSADWLVTGAFGHGEFAEWILGGVTEALLHEAALPVFMNH